MARCQCAGSSCGCQIIGGTGINMSGTGTVNSPYIATLDTNSYAVEFTDSFKTYWINQTATSEIGARAVYVIDVPPAITDATIWIPDGTINAPYPEPGVEFDIHLRGENIVINWSGLTPQWFGATPSPTSMAGLYRFSFTGTGWLAEYVPPRAP